MSTTQIVLLSVGGGLLGWAAVFTLAYLVFRRMLRVPRYTDRPASHAVAHAEGTPCPCESRRP